MSEKKSAEQIAQEKMLVAAKDYSKVTRFLKWFLSLVVIVGIAAFSWYTGNQQGYTEAESQFKQPEYIQNNMRITQIDKSVTGKSVEQDQKDALASAQKLINLAKTDVVTDADLVAATSLRMQEVVDGNFDSIPEEMRNMVAFSTGYENANTSEIAKNAYNVLIGLKSQGFDNQEVIANSDAWSGVYVHPELGIAFVPLTSFFSDSSQALPYTMVMVYENGDWKFLPQSMIESVNIAGLANAQLQATATTAPTE